MSPSVHSFMKSQMMLRCCMLMAVCFGLNQARTFSQTIFNYTNASSGVPAFVAPNVSGGPLAPGAGVSQANLACTGSTAGFGADGWPSTNIFDVNTFNMSGDYISFTLTPAGGYGLKITGFSTRSRRENVMGTINDGPIALRYGYSVNGGPWTTVNPGNPQSSNVCASSGVLRTWPSFVTLNASTPVTFRIYGLSSGTNGTGDLILQDVVVSGDVCASMPTISLGASPWICASATSTMTSLPYTSSTGTEYTMSIPGLYINQGYVALPGSPIPFTVPVGTMPGVYAGTISVRNACGFASSPQSFSVTVRALPVVTCPANTTVCAGIPAYTLTGGMPIEGTYSGTGVSGATFNPAVAGVGTHTITYSRHFPPLFEKIVFSILGSK